MNKVFGKIQVKQKGKHNAGKILKSIENPQYREVREGKVKGRKYAGGETWSGHAQQDFGGGKCGTKRTVRGNERSAGVLVWECGTRHKQNNNRWRGNRKESKSS